LLGPAGAQGTTGATGPAGTNGLGDYAYVYNLTPQVIAIEGDVPFDSNGVMTPGITHAPGAADIALSSPGDYSITFSVSGTEPGQFGLFLNGALIPGTIYGAGAGTEQDNGQVIVHVPAPNEVLTLVNHSSSAAVGLASDIGGTQANVNASIIVEKLG